MNSEGTAWTPTLVCPPEKNPAGRTFFDWDDEKLKKWKANAIKMQEVHVRDNNRTEWFQYKAEEGDAIELRILMTIYGVRMPQDETKGMPSCPLKTYNRDERLHARKIKKVIIRNTDSSEKIHFNVIYISTATKSNDSDEFLASEEPVFIVKNCRKLVDKDGQVYANFEEYKKNNNLPKGPMLAPKNGNYTPEDSDGRVLLESGETPAASPMERLIAVTEKIVIVSGIVLNVAGYVTYLAPAAFSATANSAIVTSSYKLTQSRVLKTILDIYDKISRNESIRAECLFLSSNLFPDFAPKFNQKWRIEMAKYAKEGKKHAEAAEKITLAQKSMFATVNMITFVSSATNVLSSFADVWNKKERTYLDYYQFGMILYKSTNVLTKPITIQGVFESEQLQYLDEIKNNIASEEAKEGLSSIIKQHSTSDQKAYLIRNLHKIENPTEFYESINKTGKIVTCTSDGLAIKDKTDISPKAYSEICKAVIEDKVVQIKCFVNTTLHNNLLKELGIDLTSDKLEKFVQKLDKINGLCQSKKELVRNLLKEVIDDTSMIGLAFDVVWDKAHQTLQPYIDKQLDKMINNLKQGSNATGQQTDFDKLKDLETKEINGTITIEEKKELQQQTENSTDHHDVAKYVKTVDTLEKAVAREKNLEEWKMAQNELEDAYRDKKISETEYQQYKAEIDKSIQQAKHARVIRNKADDFVNSKSNNINANELTQAIVDECKTAFEEAKMNGDETAIASANENLRVAEEFNTILETNKSFKSNMNTFTNSQNERLCYRVDVNQVKNNLQHIYEVPNVEDITVNGKKIFSNMKISEYDRLNRVLKDYGLNGKNLIIAATTIANDPAFARQINTAHDIVSITEAITTNMKNVEELHRQDYISNLASGTGRDYETFRNIFNERINAVNALDPSIKSQWGNPLSMANHWWKHEKDFGTLPLTINPYFNEYANNLFTTENLTTESYTQNELIRPTYMRSFGKRIHIGFTIGAEEIKASQFRKTDTR